MKLLQKIKEIDVKTSHFFPQFYHHKILSNTMKFIAGIGDFGMIWLLLILGLSLNHNTQLLAQKMLAALLLATIIGQMTIKSIVKRNVLAILITMLKCLLLSLVIIHFHLAIPLLVSPAQ